MRLRTLVLAAGLLWPNSVFSDSVLSESTYQTFVFQTGNGLFGICSSVNDQNTCFGYLEGAMDAFEVMSAAGLAPRLVCSPGQVTAGQVKDIVMQQLTAHPESRYSDGADLELQALQKAFPCKQQAH